MKKELGIKKIVVILLCALLCVSTVSVTSVTNVSAATKKKTCKNGKHNYKFRNATKATCTRPSVSYYKCTRCGHIDARKGFTNPNNHCYSRKCYWNASHTWYKKKCVWCKKMFRVY